MAMIESWFEQDLKKPVQVRMIGGNVFSQDAQANRIGVRVTDGGEAATLGGTVSASIIRADGTTVAQAGTLSGNECSVVLPAAAYAVPGTLIITLKLTQSGVITTLLAVVATVYRSSTDTIVDPGTIIPSVEDLIEDIEEAVASIPADYSSLWTSLAPAFSTSTAYTKGQYVTYNGGIYRFTSDHTGTWDSSDVIAVNLGREVTSAISQVASFSGMEFAAWEQGGLYSASGLPYDSTSAIRTPFIPVEDIEKLLFFNPNQATWKVYPYDSNKDFVSEYVKATSTEMYGEYVINDTIK